MNSVVKYSVGDLATRRCANRKLDNWGVAIGHFGIVNSEGIMKKMREQLELVSSIAEVNRKEDAEKFWKKQEMDKELQEQAPVAAGKLERKQRSVK